MSKGKIVHGKVISGDPWPVRLDRAVQRAWPQVACVTSYEGHGYVTRVRDKVSGLGLAPAIRKQVVAFINGFTAAEEYYVS